MSKRLPVPPELEHLIEKREHDADRRGGEKRKENLGPIGAIESAGNLDDVPTSDRRGGNERRKRVDRRKKPRGTGK